MSSFVRMRVSEKDEPVPIWPTLHATSIRYTFMQLFKINYMYFSVDGASGQMTKLSSVIVKEATLR